MLKKVLCNMSLVSISQLMKHLSAVVMYLHMQRRWTKCWMRWWRRLRWTSLKIPIGLTVYRPLQSRPYTS